MTNKKGKEISNKVALYSAKGKKEGEYELDKTVFNGKYNPYVLHQAVLMYRANKRVGLASTKVRNEVRGGGKKPWRQKGTGRARAGSIRSPLWRGGGIIFGPHPRSFKYALPKKVKRRALVDSLNSKLTDGKFSVIKELSIDEPKTKKFKEIINNTKLDGSILVACDKRDRNAELASRNLKDVSLTLYSDLNAFLVLKYTNFLITEKAIGGLSEKLKEYARRI